MPASLKPAGLKALWLPQVCKALVGTEGVWAPKREAGTGAGVGGDWGQGDADSDLDLELEPL